MYPIGWIHQAFCSLWCLDPDFCFRFFYSIIAGKGLWADIFCLNM